MPKMSPRAAILAALGTAVLIAGTGAESGLAAADGGGHRSASRDCFQRHERHDRLERHDRGRDDCFFEHHDA